MSAITVRAVALSDVGRARELNEDNAFAGERIFAVADGLGGHRAGEVASGIVVEALGSLDASVSADGNDVGGALIDAVLDANREVFEKQEAESDHRGMASTVTAIAIDGTTAHLAHVGDSRCYLIRDGSISQISQDHTLVARMVAEGKLTPEQAEYHPQRSIVTRALGAGPDVEIDTLELELAGGDKLVLCSDGLTAVLSDEEILDFVRRSRDLDATAQALVDEANARGGPDNITVVLVDVTGPRRAIAPAPGAEPARPAGLEPEPEPAAKPAKKRLRKVPVRLLVAVSIVLVAIIAAWIGVRSWVNGSWYVGVDGNRVAIFRGLPTDTLGGVLHSVEERTPMTVDQVAPFYRPRLEEGLRVPDRRTARDLVARIPQATPTPTPTQSPTPTPTS